MEFNFVDFISYQLQLVSKNILIQAQRLFQSCEQLGSIATIIQEIMDSRVFETAQRYFELISVIIFHNGQKSGSF